jgi:putative ABC transport system permease protein
MFSMVDVFLNFEKLQVMYDFGNYHILIQDPTKEEEASVAARVDVEQTGTWVSFRSGKIAGNTCDIAAVSEQFAPNMNMNLTEGRFPQAEDELMLEAWAAEELELRIEDTVSFAFEDGVNKEFRLTGIFADYGSTKAEGVPGVAVSLAAAEKANVQKTSALLILFKEKADIRAAEQQIRDAFDISEERIGRNDRLLAVIGQSDHKAATQLYRVGSVLFLIVLVAGIVMIYNSFHISVMERMRQFGLLRCVGASQAQIKKLVLREAFALLLWAIPVGLLLGVLVTIFCSALLKYFNSYIFSAIPIYTFSPIGMLAGAGVGALTVWIAALLPAKRAAKVSPVSAVTGSFDLKVRKAKKRGALMKLLPVDAAMGVGNAVIRKKTLLLMSASIAIGIVMFLGFQVFVDFMHTGLKTTKPYTPDISLSAEWGLSQELYDKLTQLDGVKYAYGRMFGYTDASFDFDRLTEQYRLETGITEGEDGRFVSPDQARLISYDENQLRWAKDDLLEGKLDAQVMNEQNGVVAVWQGIVNGKTTYPAELQAGDTVYLDTPGGRKPIRSSACCAAFPLTTTGEASPPSSRPNSSLPKSQALPPFRSSTSSWSGTIRRRPWRKSGASSGARSNSWTRGSKTARSTRPS